MKTSYSDPLNPKKIFPLELAPATEPPPPLPDPHVDQCLASRTFPPILDAIENHNARLRQDDGDRFQNLESVRPDAFVYDRNQGEETIWSAEANQGPQVHDHELAKAQHVSAMLAADPEAYKGRYQRLVMGIPQRDANFSVAEVAREPVQVVTPEELAELDTVKEPAQEDATGDNLPPPKHLKFCLAFVLFVLLVVAVGIGLVLQLGQGDQPPNTMHMPSQTSDLFGWSVAMSSDGSRVAAGAPLNDGNGNDYGYVRVFDWTGTKWVQLGPDLDGEAAGDWFGYSVAISSDGSRVAVGAPYNDGNGDRSVYVRVFDWTGTEWAQIGSDLNGEGAEDRFGYSVAMSSDGSRIAIGARGDENENGSGYAQVFDWTGTVWVQVGPEFDGEAVHNDLGHSVAMPSDGSRIAIGARYNDDNGEDLGHVRVFDWTGTDWVQVGQNLDGEVANNEFGYIVAMSSDGSRIAIGAPLNDANGNRSGQVRVFDWTGTEWVQVGPDLVGEAASDYFGWSVAMSSEGDHLVIGATGSDENGLDSGHVRVFDWTGSTWVQVGPDLDGEASGDWFGWSVDISSDGSRIATGAPFNDDNGCDSGHVRIFDWTGTEWIQTGQDLL